jgi:hypothetical protein
MPKNRHEECIALTGMDFMINGIHLRMPLVL